MDAALNAKLIRWGGIANAVGGICVAIAYLMHPPKAPPDVVASGLWIVVHVLFMISLLGGIFGAIALMVRYLAKGGRMLGFVGASLIIVALTMVFGLDYAEVFIFPTLAIEFPDVIWKYGAGDLMPSVAFAFPATGMLFMLGYVLLGWELRRLDVIAGNACLLTMAGVIVFGIGLSGMVPMLVVRTGSVLFGAGLIWMGLSLRARVGDA